MTTVSSHDPPSAEIPGIEPETGRENIGADEQIWRSSSLHSAADAASAGSVGGISRERAAAQQMQLGGWQPDVRTQDAEIEATRKWRFESYLPLLFRCENQMVGDGGPIRIRT